MCIKRFVTLAAFSILLGCMEQPASQTKAEFSVSGSTNPTRAAEILGIVTPSSATATTGRCARCHGDFKTTSGLDSLYNTTWSAYQCFTGNTTTDAGKLTALKCLAKLNPELNEADISSIDAGSTAAIQNGIRGLGASNLGFFAAAIPLESFRKIFTGNGDQFASLLTETWARTATMPKGGSTLSASDFQTALNWIMNDAPEKEKFLTHDGPATCESETETFIGANIKAHVSRMSTEGEGWMAKNQANGLKMFGCDAKGCFNAQVDGQDVFPLVNGVLKGEGEVRRLHTLTGERSTYWTRSSADGRYISYGSRPLSTIIDLAPKLAGKSVHQIAVEADYDPTFTPDNLNFMFQGDKHGSRFCQQSILANSSLSLVDFKNKDCSASDLKIGLYQGIGTNLDSGDILAVAGGFKSDEGATLVQDSAPLFTSSATIDLSRVRQTDSFGFEKVSVQRIATPFIANWMMSPSQKVLIGTVSGSKNGKARHGGYKLVMTDVLTGSTLPQASNDPNTATLCVGAGEKPQASFDERYLVYYAYEQHAEKVSASQSSANLYVIDLLGSGKPVQITSVPKGYYAQFPHFRSDGWLYFSLYNGRTGERSVVATDAILNLAK